MGIVLLYIAEIIIIFIGGIVLSMDIKHAVKYYNEKNYKDFGINMAWVIITTILLIKIII